MTDRSARLQANLQDVTNRIADAARRAGRDPGDVQLVGVTKYVDEHVTRELFAAGCRRLGESRPQALWKKAEALADLPIEWHQIGHLQRNKLAKTVPLVSLIHSVDSLRLLEAIDGLASGASVSVDVLLELNISGEKAKHGFLPAQCREPLDSLARLPHVRVRGLMCMASLEGGPSQAGHDFAALRQLRDDLQLEYPHVPLTELSMGMSGDFEAAIDQGATIVRVGSALFTGID